MGDPDVAHAHETSLYAKANLASLTPEARFPRKRGTIHGLECSTADRRPNNFYT
jgi:hypothetical protein